MQHEEVQEAAREINGRGQELVERMVAHIRTSLNGKDYQSISYEAVISEAVPSLPQEFGEQIAVWAIKTLVNDALRSMFLSDFARWRYLDGQADQEDTL